MTKNEPIKIHRGRSKACILGHWVGIKNDSSHCEFSNMSININHQQIPIRIELKFITQKNYMVLGTECFFDFRSTNGFRCIFSKFQK